MKGTHVMALGKGSQLVSGPFLMVMAVLFTLFLSSVAKAHDLVWPGEKLKTLFPLAESFDQKNLYVSDVQKASIENALKSKLQEEDVKPSVYLAVVRTSPDAPPRKAAAIMFIDAHGQGGKIEMGVVVSSQGYLQKIHIFENMEPASVLQPSFLKQFEHKTASDPFVVGKDITAPKGAEQSAQAIASGARRGLLIVNELFKKK